MRDPCESQQNQNRQRETVGASLLVAEDVKSEEWPEEETFVKRVNQPVEKGGGGGRGDGTCFLNNGYLVGGGEREGEEWGGGGLACLFLIEEGKSGNWDSR